MPAESVTVGRDEVLPAANSSRPSPPPSPPQILTMGVGAACMLDRYQHSASAVFIDSLTDFPVSEKVSQILDSDQVKGSKNTVNKDQKAKNKRKKKVLTTSDVQKNLTEEQKVCVGASTTEGNSKSYINSETEEIHVASSQVVSRKSEENLEKKHEFAINTDDLARKTEDEGEGINFK
ncbi:hypothetical protein OROHE_021480 [Orobanche hederae]